MPKSRKRKKRTKKRRTTAGGRSPRTRAGSVQQRIQAEKDRMLSVLNFDESIRTQVEEMFDINLEGLPAGKEPVFFSFENPLDIFR